MADHPSSDQNPTPSDDHVISSSDQMISSTDENIASASPVPDEDPSEETPSNDSPAEDQTTDTHHEVTMEFSAGEPPANETNEEEEDHYDREEEIVRLLLRVVSFLEVNGHGSHPVLATLLAEKILDRAGLDTNVRVGYLLKPDAPGVVIPYPWVETFLNGRKDITDLTAFGDKSKYIFALGIAIGFGDQCVKCEYHRRVPEGCKVVGTDVGEPDTVPTVSAIRREIGNVDAFLSKSAPRVRELYENVLENARLD